MKCDDCGKETPYKWCDACLDKKFKQIDESIRKSLMVSEKTMRWKATC